MQWTILVDNRTNDPSLETEHGLSIFLETGNHQLLLDTGASDLLLRNAQRLGVDLGAIDYVFISHGHSDHAGGLQYFMEVNKKAKVIVSPHALTGKYYSKRKYLHSISTSWPDIPKERGVLVDESRKIDNQLHVIAHIPQKHQMPKGNQHLFIQKTAEEYVNDDFRHEIALYVDGLLFTGCAHNGLENILAACPSPLRTVIGGFHLLDDYETEEELTSLARRLATGYPHTQFFTSHCTGDKVFATLQGVMGSQIHAFSCGTKNEIR